MLMVLFFFCNYGFEKYKPINLIPPISADAKYWFEDQPTPSIQ